MEPLLPPPTLQPSQIGFLGILVVSRHIVKAHYRHFSALALLFLLPLAVSSTTYPYIYKLIFLLKLFQQNPPVFFPTILFLILIYALFVLIFSLIAVSSVTYSVFHGFQGRPLKLKSAIKSALTSFPRLLSTWLMVSGLFSVLVLIRFSLIKATQLLAFKFTYFPPQYIFMIIFVCIVTYLQLAPVVAIIETSSWGLEPLKRSKYLVTGMKKVAFLMFLLYGFCFGTLLWLTAETWDFHYPSSDKYWFWVLYVVLGSACFMACLVSYLVAITVFYIYSKAIHGEHAEEIAAEYLRLPSDDGKVLFILLVSGWIPYQFQLILNLFGLVF
ncbi:hypothetical protein CCACVL1_01718 [Corchorus capsularis]|uniref:Uncharacterized protein n=1 Tax=Corchorus capsularis TaxID=210143 RepID=A0A1R3KG65_COCAP|nr:hypothetical protein CCACVL1_01718 [Corchorus capsularis]